MANTGVKGRIVYTETSSGIKDLEIHAFDLDPISGDDHLGKTKTDVNGHFEISYTQNDYRIWILGSDPDIVVRIYGPGHRLLHETPEKSNVQETIYDVGTIEIHRANIEGWLATNATLEPKNPTLHTAGPEKGTPKTWTPGNQVEILRDGATVFPQLTSAVDNATDSINFMNLNFWIRINPKTGFDSLITKFDETFIPGKPREGETVEGERVQKIMKDKADTLSHVNVLVNDIPLFDQFPVFQICFKSMDSLDEVRDYFKESKVNVRGSAYPILSLMHAKAVVIDGKTAFIMGSTISQGYFNDKYHLIHDARHGGSLIHDMNIKVKGPAGEHIQRAFTTVWNAADTSADPLPVSWVQQSTAEPGVGIQVVRTLPGGTFTGSHPGIESIPHGETSVLEAYQRAIAKAENFIYIENQYLTCPAIFDALKLRINQVPNLEVIIVMNMEPDIPGYPQEQIKRLRQLQGELGENKDRLGIFTLWSCDETEEEETGTKFEIMPIYVHSKAAIIDDKWATVGSANLDGASMNELQIEPIVLDLIHDFFNFLPNLVFETLPDGIKSLPGKAKSLYNWIKNLISCPDSASDDASSSEDYYDKVWRNVRKVICMIGRPIAGIVAAILIILFTKWTKIDRAFTRSTQHANPQRSRQPPRSTELNLVICDKDPDSFPPNETVVELREDLWREHLGFELDLPDTPKGLELWKQRAEDKLKAIKNKEKHPAKILEWKPEIDPKKYLQALGVKTGELCIRKNADEFKFETGKWERERTCL